MPGALRIPLLAVLLALACTPVALAVPVHDVRGRYAGGRLDVTAVVESPASGGCAVAVTAGWSRIGGPGRPGPHGPARAAALPPAPGLVTKSGEDGDVATDACARLAGRPMWTEGDARLQFRPPPLAPGAYRVCVRAAQVRADGSVDAHRACTVLRVPRVARAVASRR